MQRLLATTGLASMVHVSREVVRRSARTLTDDELQGYDATEDKGMPYLRRVLDAPLQHFGEDHHWRTDGTGTRRARRVGDATNRVEKAHAAVLEQALKRLWVSSTAPGVDWPLQRQVGASMPPAARCP
jgi:hypothetical protein